MEPKETKKQELPDGITAEMITAAKAKHGADKVKYIDIINDETGETKTVLAAVPSRSVIGFYQRFEASDPKKAQELLVKNCLLSHKDEVLADDALFFGALSGIAELIPVRRTIVKNC